MCNEETIIPSRIGKNGLTEAEATLTPSSNQADKIISCDPRPAIPVIFLPGVMGTNLKSRKGKSVWSPPNMSDVVDIVGAID
jgi:hypothetical protein